MTCPAGRWKQQLTKGFLLTISMMFLMNAPSYSQEEPVDILAAAVRQHGHVCDRPESAEPDPQDTSAGEKAWVLHCEDGAFRVKFMGDAGAKVEPVSE